MKKFITLFVILFSAIALTSCFGELESLEWEVLPKSVYYVREMTEQQFKESVSIKINRGDPLTLAAALSSNPTDLTFIGFDLDTPGSKMITIKYKSVSIYWAYQVIAGDIPSDEVKPKYDWYEGKSSPYTLKSIEDLYGFANIVNGKYSETADSFAGETVKLAADIDLTGKVWEPIGAAPRKTNYELNFVGTVGAGDPILVEPTEKYSLYFNNSKLYFIKNDGNPEEVRFGSASNAPVITDEADFVTKFTAAKDDLYELDGFYFIDSYVFVSYTEDENLSFDDFEFYFSVDVLDETLNFFEGTFDGQGHKITGLSDVGYTPTIVETYANSNQMVKGYTFGLFGVVKNNVTIKNLIFEDVSVVGAYYQVDGGIKLADIDSVGAAVGYSFGVGDLTIDNVKVLSGSVNGYQAVGGIVGRAYNDGNILIQNCENHANISLTGVGAKHTGGIAGYVSRSILNDGEDLTPHTVIFKNNTNYGNVTGPADMAGAMVRYVGNGTTATTQFINCRNFGNITGSSMTDKTKRYWGIVGQYGSRYSFDSSCVNYGTIVN